MISSTMGSSDDMTAMWRGLAADSRARVAAWLELESSVQSAGMTF